ncbi:MAG: hypothetical protein JPMHGGIA_00373 [Saprospiraceae bacterium]|nr:hypothetical protein [Saprospiraceae bacterium]
MAGKDICGFSLESSPLQRWSPATTLYLCGMHREVGPFKCLVGPCQDEIAVKGSKFIAYGWPVHDIAEVEFHLKKCKEQHHKARHWCYAWILGSGAGQQFRSCDDGEPAGTAGRPILQQLQAHHVTNAVIIVVRYFGGILLGTGGLAKAYRDAAKAGLARAELVDFTPMVRLIARSDAAQIQVLYSVLKELGIQVDAFELQNDAHLHFTIPEKEQEEWVRRIRSRLQKKPAATLDGYTLLPGYSLTLDPACSS